MINSPAIAVQNLKFSYGKATTPLVLDIKELTIPRGERIFLHGPSGTGKTTLLALLAGILDATAGEIQVLGQSYAAIKGTARDHFRGAHIGYIFQMFNLIPYLDVVENIILPCRVSKTRMVRLKGANPYTVAGEIAVHLDIGNLLNKKVTDLSVGQQQRVAAARALMGAPELIIADEPTSALDTDRREQFLKLLFLEAERSKATVLFVSHDKSLAPLFTRTISLGDVNQARAQGELS